MNLVTVDSSMLYAVGYDPASQELHVVFRTGRIYAYDGVPAAVHDALLAAESKGQHMRANVIGRYPHRQISTRSTRGRRS